jgi:hypothetical protein
LARSGTSRQNPYLRVDILAGIVGLIGEVSSKHLASDQPFRRAAARFLIEAEGASSSE